VDSSGLHSSGSVDLVHYRLRDRVASLRNSQKRCDRTLTHPNHMKLSFAIPSDVSFEQAIALTQDLLACESPDAAWLESAVGALVQTENGARGFFVTFLTGDYPLADQPTAAILQGLQSSPAQVADLLAKNLAMSTAMEIAHRRNQDLELAAGSAKVQRRSLLLIQLLQLPALQVSLEQLLASVTSDGGEYQSFLNRWGYDAEQRQAIQAAISAIKPTEYPSHQASS
jgi:hypothetical protein